MRDNAGTAIVARDLGIRYRRYIKKVTTIKDVVTGFFRSSSYETFWALRGVSFTILPGEQVAIIGPNGSGKSTLIKAIARILPPSEGGVTVSGRVIPLELGGGFRGELTGRENIFLNGAIMGLNKRQMEARVDRIVGFAEIGDFIDAPLNTYSSGMKARLGFAVATDIDPDILLLDEVLSVGDAAFKKKALAKTKSFFEAGKTVILVSHNMDHVRAMCSRALYIRHGQVVADGAPDAVIAAYEGEVDSKSA